MDKRYRIWCNTKNEWEKDYVMLSPNGILYTEHTRRMIPLRPDTHTIEFCTGLTAAKSYRGDSDDARMVFEGDVVKDDTNVAIVKFGIYTANNNKSYFNEEAYGYYLEYFSHVGVIDHISHVEYCEIIGTIHDNPELLDEEGDLI